MPNRTSGANASPTAWPMNGSTNIAPTMVHASMAAPIVRVLPVSVRTAPSACTAPVQ
jgi:hypothetical protein